MGERVRTRSLPTTNFRGEVLVTLVTSNPGKFREVDALLRPYGIRLHWSRRELPEPQADTLREVVAAKLDALPVRAGWYLVEDSGLFIPALGGFPGVYSSYVHRTLGPRRLAALLSGLPREAVFRTVAGLQDGSRRYLVEGRCRGTIAHHPRGQGGFGFDPVFVPAGNRRTFAEMPAESKSALSHRGEAIRRVARILRAGGAKPAG
jgi:XTP/dITP diphosphohydrolase